MERTSMPFLFNTCLVVFTQNEKIYKVERAKTTRFAPRFDCVSYNNKYFTLISHVFLHLPLIYIITNDFEEKKSIAGT